MVSETRVALRSFTDGIKAIVKAAEGQPNDLLADSLEAEARRLRKLGAPAPPADTPNEQQEVAAIAAKVEEDLNPKKK